MNIERRLTAKPRNGRRKAIRFKSRNSRPQKRPSTEKQACSLAYVTFPGEQYARKAAHEITRRHLAAGANLLGPVYSIYHWQGNIRQREEWLLFAQIARAQFRRFSDAVKELHPDVNPCVIALPIIDGSKPFLSWILKNCRQEATCPLP